MKKKIGMIIAVEFAPFKEAYGEAKKVVKDRGFEVSIYEKEKYILYVTQSGAGEILAAICTQYLIDTFDVDMILNYGVVGGLSEKLSHALTCVIKDVVDYRFDISEVDPVEKGRHTQYPSRNIPTNETLRKKALEVSSSLLEVRCASGDKFVNDPNEKQNIAKEFGADICEMEAAGILLTCNMNKIPSLFIKVIADTLFGGAGEYLDKSNQAVKECVKILEHIMDNI